MSKPHLFRLLLTALCLPLAPLTAQTADKPNIVLIFADDLGWQDTGFAGSDYAETPNLDRLAAEGMVFSNAYAAAGNCQPSRACLVSGHYTPRHDVYAVGSTERGPKNLMRMIPIPNQNSLPNSTRTIGEALKEAGYATGLFGKQHLKASDTGKAEETGFDVVKVSQQGLNSTDPDDPKGIFSLADAACEFIEANRERPFFAYIPHFAIHSKLQAREETLAKFKNRPAGKNHDDPLFAACIADLDSGVGQVLDKLEELGLTEKTLVVFTSDNGGTDGTQEPLRGKKGSYYEGGIRVPMAVRWPGVVAPGTTTEEPAISIDLYPTFLEAAGVNPADGQILDGSSLVPVLRGDRYVARAPIFWHFPGYLDGAVQRGRDPVFRTRPVSVIRKDGWKLHLYHEEWQLDGGREKLDSNNAVELYDLANDPGERQNLALDPESKAKRDELLDELLAWFDSSGAKLPQETNPAYDPSKKPTGKNKGKAKEKQ